MFVVNSFVVVKLLGYQLVRGSGGSRTHPQV